MQKLADGQDTDVGSSLAWLWSRCVGVPQPGAAPSWEAAGWLSAGELAAGPGGADEPVHPVAAPASRTATHAYTSRSRPVMCVLMVLRGLSMVLRGLSG